MQSCARVFLDSAPTHHTQCQDTRRKPDVRLFDAGPFGRDESIASRCREPTGWRHEVMQHRFAALVAAVVVLLAQLAAASPVGAQNWPTKTIKIVSSYAPGGTVDALARLVAPYLQQRLGQAVIVENRTGAGGTIGAAYVAQSAKDGYTLLVGAVGNISSAASLYKNLTYDPVRDLQPLTMATRVSNVVVAHPSLGVKSIKELLAKAKAEPGKLAYGSGGVGTSLHLSGELFKLLAGVDIVHVPYKGSGPVVSDLVSGQLMLAFADSAVMEHVRGGRLIALGQTAGERQEQIKEVPTIGEAGVPGYNAANWQGFLVAAGTPAPIVERLHKELTAVLSLDEVKTRIEALGMAPVTSTPEQFKALIADDIKLWADVIRRAGITTGQ